MNKKTLAVAIAAAPLVALAIPGTSWATVHTDPCPGEDHIQVWSQVGGPDSRKGQATNHFVCEGDLAGPQGPKGDKGETGAPGATGEVGPAGPKGATGDAGPAGDVGPAGPQGLPGVGLPGATGPAGPQGPQGATGPAGAPGVAGADGATGPVGPVGPKGEDAVFNYEVSAETENCKNGGYTVTVTDGNDEGGGSFEICNGLNGENGTNKTVIVHHNADDTTTTEEIPGLPSTGSDSDTAWMLGLIGAGILATGAGALYFLRDKA